MNSNLFFSLRNNSKGNINLWRITLKFSKIEFIYSMIIGVSTTIMVTSCLSLAVLLFPNEFRLPLNSYIVWLPFQKFSSTWAFNYVFQITSFVGASFYYVAYLCVTLILMNHTCWIVEAAKLRLTNLNSYLEENETFDDDDDDKLYEETQFGYSDEACDDVKMHADVIAEKNHRESPDSITAIIDYLLFDEIYHKPTIINQDGPSNSGYQRPNQSNFRTIDSDDSVDTIYLAPNTDSSARQHLRVNNTKRQFLPAPTTDEECKELIKEVVIMICELMEWKNNLNHVMRFNFMVELSIISMVFAMCIFVLGSDLSSLIVNACFTTVATFSEFFCYCLMGTRVLGHIDELTAEIYNVKWYLMTPKQRLDILVLLPLTQKMKTFDGIFKEINTTTFQQVKLSAKSTENVLILFNFQILNFAYSLYGLLRAV